MATNDKKPADHLDQHGRPIREVPNDTTKEEMEAGHHTPGGDPPKNDDARGGFGNRDGKQGYGTDSEDGVTAVSVNSRADSDTQPKDNMRSTAEGRPLAANQDGGGADELDGYADAAEFQAANDATAQLRRQLASDTGASGEPPETNPALTEDGNNVRPDAAISGQDGLTFAELARRGTNASITDPDAKESGLELGA